MWICQKCNTQNTANFCMNCGTQANAQEASDLPPTVIGMMPPIMPTNQPNQFQNQPNFQPQQPQFAPQFQPQVPQPQQQQYQQEQFSSPASQPQVLPPRKSNVKKFVVLGGIIGLLVFAVGGFALWRNVIQPYHLEQWRLKKETDNQNRANSTTAMSLVPVQFDYYGAAGDVYRRKETLDKLQMLQASQNLPPELKQKISEINDAAAASYISDKNSNQKVLLQIFKFNTPERAKAVCQEIVDEVEKKRDSFKSVSSLRGSIRPGYCFTVVEGKNNENFYATSNYGFLYVSSGNAKAPVSAANEKISDQIAPY